MDLNQEILKNIDYSDTSFFFFTGPGSIVYYNDGEPNVVLQGEFIVQNSDHISIIQFLNIKFLLDAFYVNVNFFL